MARERRLMDRNDAIEAEKNVLIAEDKANNTCKNC